MVDEEGATALLYATKENEFAAVKLLLAHFANPNIALKNGTTPLHEAAANGSIRTCKLLVENKALLDAATKNGTALHMAVSENREKTVEALIELGANVNATNEQGITPLLLCCLMNKPLVAKELLTANANLKVTIMGGITALHVAAETGFTEIVQEFLATRAEDTVVAANVKSDHGATPLQLAAGMGHMEIVKLLQPITKGFETADLEQLMASEKVKLDAYYEDAAKKQTKEIEKEPENEQDAQKLAGIVPEEEIVAPEAVELDAATLTKATEFKNDGNKAYIAKDYARAVDLYTQAIALSPADAVLYSNRCAAHLGAGDAKTALHDVRISKKLKPQWAKALFREGQCLEALKLYEEAACAMWSAMQLAPDDKVLKKRFQACVARGREDHQAKLAEDK